jgi:hypothetical protein
MPKSATGTQTDGDRQMVAFDRSRPRSNMMKAIEKPANTPDSDAKSESVNLQPYPTSILFASAWLSSSASFLSFVSIRFSIPASVVSPSFPSFS